MATEKIYGSSFYSGPPPVRDPVVDSFGLITTVYMKFLNDLVARVKDVDDRLGAIEPIIPTLQPRIDVIPTFEPFFYTTTVDDAPMSIYTLDKEYRSGKIIVFMNARVLEPTLDYVEQIDENGNRTQIRFLKPPRENNNIHGIFVPV